MTKVFISYAREDEFAAKRLHNDLEKVPSIQPWIDRKGIRAGDRWKHKISDAMRDSQFIVILLSKISVSKVGFFQREIHDAIELSKERPPDQTFLIPVKLEQCDSPYPELHELHYVNLDCDWDTGVREIVDMVQGDEKTNTDPATIVSTLRANELPTDLPIGPGLHPVVQIAGGIIRYTKTSIPMPQLLNQVVKVTTGSVFRSNTGTLEAILWTQFPVPEVAVFARRFGLDRIRLKSESFVLSVDRSVPTVFSSQKVLLLPKGASTYDFASKKEVVVPIDIPMALSFKARGILTGSKFNAEFVTTNSSPMLPVPIVLEGIVSIDLA